MSEVDRINVDEARKRVNQGDSLLVMAYDSRERYDEFHLQDSISLPVFKDRLDNIDKSRELIFY